MMEIARLIACDVEDIVHCPTVAADGAELQRRAKAPASEFVDADALLDAIDEANEAGQTVRTRPVG